MLDVTDEMLEELLQLEELVRAGMTRIEEIKSRCRSFGSFATDRYVCVIQEVSRTTSVPANVLVEKLGPETVRDMGLTKVSKYYTVRVNAKGQIENRIQ